MDDQSSYDIQQVELGRETPRGLRSTMNSADALDVTQLARDALRELASRAPPTVGPKFDLQVKCFCEKLIEFEPDASRDYLTKLTSLGVSYDELVERYIPAAARLLGEKWVNNDLSFCMVTVGSARLQEMARTLERRTEQALDMRIAANPVLIATPPGEQHTLGAMMAASQMRRLGFETRLEFGLEMDDFAKMTRNARFAAVGLSSSSKNNLDALRRLADNLREHKDFQGAIAIGGAITLVNELDVAELTGADLVTDDLRAFATHCCPG